MTPETLALIEQGKQAHTEAVRLVQSMDEVVWLSRETIARAEWLREDIEEVRQERRQFSRPRKG
jgi:hypothetical protein